MKAPSATITTMGISQGNITVVAALTFSAARWKEIIRDDDMEDLLVRKGFMGKKDNMSRAQMGRMLQKLGKLMAESTEVARVREVTARKTANAPVRKVRIR